MHKLPAILRRHFSSACQLLRGLAVTLSIWLAVAGTTFAQKGKPEPEQPKGYFLSYTLLVLCLVLGVYCTARPSKRTSEIKKEIVEE